MAYQCLQPNSGNYGARNGLLDKTFSYQKIIFKCGDSVRGRYVTGNCDATFSLLMVARVMQAMGNGIVLPMTQVVVLTIYGGAKRNCDGNRMVWRSRSSSCRGSYAGQASSLIYGVGGLFLRSFL